MTQTLVKPTSPSSAEIMERVLITGDLNKLEPMERVTYYARVCESIGLNPLTRPFQYISLQGKLVLYATRDATDQLRSLRSVSVVITSREKLEDIYVVTARATTPDGRTDESTGAVSVGGLKGESLANAYMKAETKAKRRVTMSICGLGWMDESEVSSVPDAQLLQVDTNTGEVLSSRPVATKTGLNQKMKDSFTKRLEGYGFPDTLGFIQWWTQENTATLDAITLEQVEGMLKTAEQEYKKAMAEQDDIQDAELVS